MGVDSGDGEPTIVEVDSATNSQAGNDAFQEFVGRYREALFDGDRSLRSFALGSSSL
ncbi:MULTISPECIES: hypothetical protein [Mesorhizobium]|nr:MULTISPECIES: hypothetical protein [Mesorhizobium]MDX8437729.1 hypothetical protein [Mesorhizobium abyssinicae]MDX8461293.1 hypothetical protein [Mesorhizobium sp. VK2D]MDX8488903.1 hypothetical protein [Mesorhizobium sp. VK2B]MDX8515896.1 hypothetical protein [Mesorhizobium sp. VK23E]MDX8539438.1 hypothetical protein [Mesorhizobium abyssinicae]